MGYIKKFSGNVDKAVQIGGQGNPESIEGYFLGTKTTQSDYGEGKLHVFQTQDGTIGVWGKTRLNSLLTDDIKGQMCRVIFTGMIQPSKKGRRPSYGYDVEHDPENTTDVAHINLSAATTGDDQEDDVEELINEDDVADEITPERPSAPTQVAKTPSASSQARVQALLSKGRTSKTV